MLPPRKLLASQLGYTCTGIIPGSSTAVLSTAVSSTPISSTDVSSTQFFSTLIFVDRLCIAG